MKSRQQIKLAENLKRLIAVRNETVTSTANKVRMHKSSLHNYCNGVVPRSLKSLEALASFFEVSLCELVFGTDSKSDPISPKEKVEGRFEVIIRRIGD